MDGYPQWPQYMMPQMPEMSPEMPHPYPPYGPPRMPESLQPIQPGPPAQQRPKMPRGRWGWRRAMKEPVLFQHLNQLTGRQVYVSTLRGDMHGTLGGVFPDHIQVQKSDRKYHVRLNAICYVAHSEET